MLGDRIRGSLGRRRGPGRASGEQTRRLSSLSRWASSSPRGRRSWPGAVRIRAGPSQPEKPGGSAVRRPRVRPWAARPGAAGAPAQGPGSSDTLGASKPGPREGFGMCQACRTDGGRGQVSPSRSPRLHRAASPGRCLCPWWSPSRSCCSLGQPWLTPRSRGAGVRRAHAKARSKAVETAVVGSQESPAQRRNRSWGHL